VASYKILFKPSIEKDLSSIPKAVAGRAMAGIEALAENPFSHGS